MVLATENCKIIWVGALVSDVAERLAAGRGASPRWVLALVPVPSVAGVDKRKFLLDLVAETLLLGLLDWLFEKPVFLVGRLFRFFSCQSRLRPGAEEGLPGVLEVPAGEEWFAVAPLVGVLEQDVVHELAEQRGLLLNSLEVVSAVLVVNQEIFDGREGHVPR